MESVVGGPRKLMFIKFRQSLEYQNIDYFLDLTL